MQRDAKAPAGSVRAQQESRLGLPTEALILELTTRLREGLTADSFVADRLLGVLAAEVAARRSPANRYSAQASLVHLSNLMGHPDITLPQMPELLGATCLDFGSGGLNPGGGLFALLLAGAQRGVALDIDDIDSIPCAVGALYTVLCAAITGTTEPGIPGTPAEILARIASFDVAKLAAGDPSGIDEDRLRYRQTRIQDADIPDGSIDILVTNSVLEHIADLDDVLAELARVVRPGGLASHAIDGFDHRHYGQPDTISPHEFLFDPSDAAMICGCNRIRPLAFAERFEKAGFEVRKIVPSHRLPLTDADLERLAPSFRDLPREHLEVTRARYYLRRR